MFASAGDDPSVSQSVSTITEKAPTRLGSSTLLRVMISRHIVLNVKALVGTFNQEKALVGAFSMIVQPVVKPMEHYTAL